MALYLSYDIGTTSLKTALFDSDGRMLAIHVSEYTFQTPHPGWAEMIPNDYWNAVIKGTHAVFSKSGLDPSALASIGFSSQGQTFIPINRIGQPLYNAIVWLDNRAQSIADEWEADWMPRNDFRHITGYPQLPAELTVFKIAWLRQNAPEAHKAWKFLCVPDFLVYKMTGETATDRVIAQFSGLYNLQTKAWELRFLDAIGIAGDQLPAVLNPGTVAGSVSKETAAELNIPMGIPVCAGVNDQIAGAVGAGNTRPGVVTETTGTALAVVATTKELLDDSGMTVGHHAGQNNFAMPFGATSGIILKWFRDMCAKGEDYTAFTSGVKKIPVGCDGLSVLPHFAGAGSPTFNPDARGAFIGLTMAHTRTHMVRAIMESCCCLLKECLDTVQNHGIELTSVRSLGGAARSSAWLQMKADLLGMPVEKPICSDAASLGAAMLAATGAGQFKNVEEASEAWYRHSEIFEPNPATVSTWNEIYMRYLDLYKKLYG